MKTKSVDEIRTELLSLGYSKDEVMTLGKADLKKLLEEAQSISKSLDTAVETVGDPETLQAIADSEAPAMTSPKWTDYVLGLFEKNELDNGSPKADALRRVAELLLGPFNNRTKVEQVPTIENGGRATVSVEIELLANGQVFSGAADVYSGNTERTFAVHAVATAETRAEGRALRKALRLTKVLTAEELQNADVDEPTGIDGRIVSSMVNNLKLMSSNLNVDPVKVAVVMGLNIQVLEDLTHKQALDIANKLAEYRRNPQTVPAEVR
jgi:hypothetical protein